MAECLGWWWGAVGVVESRVSGDGQDLLLPMSALLSDLGSCLQAEGEGTPPGSGPSQWVPRQSCLCPVNPVGASVPAAGQTRSTSSCRGSETPLGLPGLENPFPFYSIILPPSGASWSPSADLGLPLPWCGVQPGSETRRSERGTRACPQPPGNTGEARWGWSGG